MIISVLFTSHLLTLTFSHCLFFAAETGVINCLSKVKISRVNIQPRCGLFPVAMSNQMVAISNHHHCLCQYNSRIGKRQIKQNKQPEEILAGNMDRIGRVSKRSKKMRANKQTINKQSLHKISTWLHGMLGQNLLCPWPCHYHNHNPYFHNPQTHAPLRLIILYRRYVTWRLVLILIYALKPF